MENPNPGQGGRTDRPERQNDEGGNVGTDPRRTREQDKDRENEQNRRPNQTPKTA
jgi:hypothetical protein